MRQDEQARADEEARQARIKQGRSQIDALFDRGETLKTPETKTQYTDPAKDLEAWRTYQATGYYQQPSETITTPATWEKTQPAFDKAYYDARKQAYIDNYTPQLADQFNKARADMTYALARAGLTRSSAATDQVARLNEANAVQTGTIGSQAEDFVSKQRSNVEDQRANLVSQLQSSADPGGTANLALARTQSIRAEPVTYSPLGDVFNGIVSGIGHFVQGAQTQAFMNNRYGLQAQPASGGTTRSGQGSRTVSGYGSGP